MTQEQAGRIDKDPAPPSDADWHKAIFDCSPNAIVLTEVATGKVRAANPAARRMLGYTEEQLRGIDRSALFGSDDPYRPGAFAQGGFEAVVRTDQFHGELMARRADGSSFPVELTQSSFQGPDGKPMAAIFFMDIGERKAAEAALRENASRYRLLFENMEEGFALHEIVTDACGNAVDFRFLAANQAFEHHTGLHSGEITGRHMLEVMPGADMRQIEAYGRVALTGEPLAFDYHSNTFGRDLRVRAYSPARGQFATIFEDITEHKQVEQVLARLASIVESSDAAIVGTDLDGRITSWNRGAERIYGYAARDMIGASVFTELMPGNAVDPQAFVARIRQGGTTHLQDLPWRTPAGETLVLSVTLGPVRTEDGTLIGFYSITHDITQRKQLEEDLRQSEQRYRMLADNIPDIVFATDASGQLTYVSPSVERLRGCTAEEALTEPRASRYTAGSLAGVQRHMAQCVAEAAAGRPLSEPYYEAEHRRKDGSSFWGETILRPRSAPDGTFCGFVGVVRDISERKELEEALRRREERLRLLVENSPDVIWIWDQGGKLKYVSQAVESMYGVPPQAMIEAAAQAHARAAEVPAEQPAEPAPGEFAPDRQVELGAPPLAFLDGWRQAFRAVQTCVQSPGVKVRLEGGLVMPDGKVRSLHTTFQGFRRSTTGVEVVAVTHEVTELVAAKEQLQDALRQLSLATDAAEIGIWKWRFADNSLEWDKRLYELYAIPPEKDKATGEDKARGRVISDDWRARLLPEDLARCDVELAKVLRTGWDWHTTFRILLPDGRIRYIYSAAVVDRNQAGEQVGMIGINRDVTDQMTYEQYLQDVNAVLEQRVAARTDDLRQLVEELQLANAGKDAFLAAVSHELRTPLTGILSVAEALETEVRGPLNEHQQRYVAAIQLNGNRLLAIVKNVLDYTSAMTDSAPRLELCRLAELCVSAVKSAKPKARAKQQHIEVNIDPFDLQLISDGDSIMQILEALLDNAVKFTPSEGRLGIDVSAVDGDSAVQIAVWDTGIGIKEEQRPYLFKPLTQGDQRLTRHYEGIGLGLALVKRRAEVLGGSVVVESAVDQGSRFIVTLPANLKP